jgi:hypothetical protein
MASSVCSWFSFKPFVPKIKEKKKKRKKLGSTPPLHFLVSFPCSEAQRHPQPVQRSHSLSELDPRLGLPVQGSASLCPTSAALDLALRSEESKGCGTDPSSSFLPALHASPNSWSPLGTLKGPAIRLTSEENGQGGEGQVTRLRSGRAGSQVPVPTAGRPLQVAPC